MSAVEHPRPPEAPFAGIESLDLTQFRQEVVLRCPAGVHHGTIINGRYLRIPCRRSKRKRDGLQAYDVFDLVLGRHVRVEYQQPIAGRVSRQEE